MDSRVIEYLRELVALTGPSGAEEEVARTIAGALSVGNRYTHSPVEVLDANDLEQAVCLLRHLLPVVAAMDLQFAALD